MNPVRNGAPATKIVRCAVYTRKSTEEGLDQEFNSLDAQREAATAYIHSQQHAGWYALPERYDDGGFKGGNLDPPAPPAPARRYRGRSLSVTNRSLYSFGKARRRNGL